MFSSHPSPTFRPRAAALFAALALACAPASPPQPPEELVRVPGEGTAVIYVEAPRRLAGPLLKTFEEQTGIDVQPQYRQPIGEGFGDTLRSEAAAGRVDLVWADGPLTACELAEAGLARVFRPLGARPVLPLYRDPEFRWIGFAANPRVIIYNSRQVDRAGAPVSIHDMAQGPWAGKGALARPERGGAAYHAAFLFAAWGPERGREFFEAILKNGTRIVEEDAEVRRLVASGEVQWGFVGLDEAICAKREAEPVQIVYPDRISFPGTAIPAQIAILIEGGPHPEQARGLYGWMFEKEAGFVLGTHDCAMVTLLPDMPKHDWVPALSTFNIAPIDSGAVCRAWKEQAPYLRAWGRSAPPAAAPATGATAR